MERQRHGEAEADTHQPVLPAEPSTRQFFFKISYALQR